MIKMTPEQADAVTPIRSAGCLAACHCLVIVAQRIRQSSPIGSELSRER